MNNAIDGWMNEDLTPAEERQWRQSFEIVPERMNTEEKRAWLKRLTGVSFASDAFLPFRDNIDRAAQSGVQYVVQSGHSVRDEQVVQAANEYGMAMAYSGVRLFHH